MTADRWAPTLPRRARQLAAVAAPTLLALATFAAAIVGGTTPALAIRARIAPSVAREASPAGPRWQQMTRGLMGTRFFIQARVRDDAQADALQRAMDRVAALERLWSPWIEGSDLHRINTANGAAVVVEPETIALLQRSLALCRASGGAFDPTFFALSDLWNLKAQPFVPPTAEAIAARLPAVGCAGVRLNAVKRTVRLLRPGAKIHLGANAKGTALDAVASLLRGAGIADFAVDGGGDLVLAGQGPKGPWRVGIQDPRGARGAILARIDVSDVAVATSGDNERFAIVDGRRYHHIVDPRTGWPAELTRQITVIVSAKGAGKPRAKAARLAGESADALATALFVLGPVKGQALLRKHPGVDALWLDAHGAWHPSPGMARRLAKTGWAATGAAPGTAPAPGPPPR